LPSALTDELAQRLLDLTAIYGRRPETVEDNAP
jgi:hypothetical protein